MYNEKIQDRDISLDILKGFAIILVVYGHCVQAGNGAEYSASQSYLSYLPYNLIYGFHMPLFMLISGYLFYAQVQKHSAAMLLRRSLKRYLLPIFCWSVLGFTWRIISGGYAWLGIGRFIGDYVYFAFDYLWFLAALLFSSLIMLAAERLPRVKWLLPALVTVAIFFIPDLYLHSTIKFTYIYFVAGCYAHRHSQRLRLPKTLQVLAAVALLVLYLMLVGSTDAKSLYIYTGGFGFPGRDWTVQLPRNLLRWITGFAGSGAAVFTVRLIIRKSNGGSLSRALSHLGQKSLYIYILSSLILTPVLRRLTEGFSFNHANALLETAVILAVTLPGEYIVRKIRPINLLFFGGK